MKRIALLLAATCVAAAATATAGTGPVAMPADTARVLDMEEVVVIGSPKETGKLRELPAAVSLLSQQDLQVHRVQSLKNASALVPNFFMPDYGSRLTSAIYIRGIGSRINTPAVGMYVDNIPYIDKSAFDFNFYDIERIDILRGPQGTLYGRNTMGGLVKVHTRSPFSYQGTDVRLGYGSRSNHRSAALTHYHRPSERFAFSAGGYYEGSDGFFRNAVTGKKVDRLQAGGGRLRAVGMPGENLKLDFTLGYDYTDEGGYPYRYTGATGGEESYPEWVGKIGYDRPCSYRRGMLNAGLNLEYQAQRYVLSSVTGYQRLDDRMFLDQDFLPVDIYTLEQKQRLNALSQEVTLKSKGGGRWEWVTGVGAFVQGLRTDGPVDFRSGGVAMLEGIINSVMPDLSDKGITSMGVHITDEGIRVGGTFDTPVANAALFHQSTVRLAPRLWLTAGLRLDYEHTSMTYRSSGDIHYDFTMNSGRMPVKLEGLQASPSFDGKLKNDYTQLLPRFALKYGLAEGKGNVYATVSKGFRSGGYNVQMFSELVQGGMRREMMQTIYDKSMQKLDGLAQMGMPAHIINMIKEGLGQMPLDNRPLDVRATTVYQPEYSWNYEAGAHLSLFDGRLRTDLAAFYMDTRDQQIARFVDSGLGRMMVNAGSSRSYGAEATLVAEPLPCLSLNVGYGYTHATFRHYDGGNGLDYSGNYVPFVPRHTFNAGATYRFRLSPSSPVKGLNLSLNYTGAGKIYWTESNRAAQSFSGTLNGRASISFSAVQVDVWGRNLTNSDYETFYFESMGRGFGQRSKPAQVGVDIRMHF